MKFIDKFDLMLSERKLNKAEFSRLSGVPYTTVDGFYKKGTDNIKLSTLQKIATCLNCTVDYLAIDSITEPHGTNSKPTPPAKISDKDIMFALLDGDKYEEIPDEVFNEVKEFAQWIAEKKMREQK